MKVKDAIKWLSKLPPDEHIVIAWWDIDSFFPDDYDWFEPRVSTEEWNYVTEVGEDIDWSDTHDTIRFFMEEAIRDGRKG